MASVRLDWTREEIIMAIDLYVRAGAMNGGPIPGRGSRDVIELSTTLKRLSAYPVEMWSDKYRNPDGVYLKLTNLRAIETGGMHGMNAFSQLDAAVWREYVGDLSDLTALHQEADAIRRRINDGVIQPARSSPLVEDVEIEQQHSETYVVRPDGATRASERAEQKLVIRYRDYMAHRNVTVKRKRYRPRGEPRPIYSDIWVEAATY